MIPFLVFVLRILAALALFGFLGWAMYTLWRDLRFQSEMVTTRKIPPITLSLASEPEETRKTFTSSEIIIGRDATADYPLSDETVSGRHARLSYRYLQWWVEDMQSTNGTFLNDEKVESPTIIINSDEIRIGQIPILVEIQPFEQ